MPGDYVIMADDNCDMPYGFYKENNIALLKMPYSVDGDVYYGEDITTDEFYDLIREGKRPTTIAANTEEIMAVMEDVLKDGKDIIYLVFSSGLSSTYGNAVLAVKDLSQKYPERKIEAIDSLCASMGEGLFVYMAARMKRNGASFDELVDWAVNNRLNVAHYVMADDLMHLHRGGRVSKASAIAGSMLGIKPILYMDNAGKLLAIDKIRGKKQALTAIVDRIEKACGDTKPDFFMISHADCAHDADFTAELMKKRFGITEYMINYIGPVIGSHTGTGTVALYAMAEHR